MGVASAVLIVIITIFCKLDARDKLILYLSYDRLASKRMLTHVFSPHSSVPPLGAWMVAGCGADLFVNICLTLLG